MKKSELVTLIIRMALSLALVYGVFTETGIWTTIMCLLIVAYIELHNYLHKLQIYAIALQSGILEKLNRIAQ